MKRSLRATLTFLLVAGCTGPPRPAAVEVADEDGVRVVTSSGSSDAVSGWRLREVYHTGWEDDEPTFEFITTGKIRADGSVVIADANGGQVWVLDPEGEVLHAVGREGEGPGEYRWLDAAIPGLGDTTYVQSDNGRFSTFAGTEVVETLRTPWGFRQDNITMELTRRLPGGDFYLTYGSYSSRGGTDWRQAPALVMHPDLETLDTILMYDAVRSRPSGDRNPLNLWGATWPVGDSGIVVGRNDEAEVRWYDFSGRARQIARWDHQPREMTDAQIDEYIAVNLARGSREVSEQDLARMMQEQREAISGPLPIWRRIFSDAAGNVWLTSYGDHPLDFGGDAFVIAADGQWLGSVHVPDGVMLMDVTERWVLGVRRNEWDIQAVYLWEVDRP